MIVQAIALLDDLDKEINIYAMRVKVSSNHSRCCLNSNFVATGMVWMAFP